MEAKKKNQKITKARIVTEKRLEEKIHKKAKKPRNRELLFLIKAFKMLPASLLSMRLINKRF